MATVMYEKYNLFYLFLVPAPNVWVAMLARSFGGRYPKDSVNNRANLPADVGEMAFSWTCPIGTTLAGRQHEHQQKECSQASHATLFWPTSLSHYAYICHPATH